MYRAAITTLYDSFNKFKTEILDTKKLESDDNINLLDDGDDED